MDNLQEVASVLEWLQTNFSKDAINRVPLPRIFEEGQLQRTRTAKQRASLARRMRECGLKYKEIAAHFNVSVSRARQLVNIGEFYHKRNTTR